MRSFGTLLAASRLWRRLQPVEVSPCKLENPQAEASHVRLLIKKELFGDTC
jgi:hypothetical protein